MTTITDTERLARLIDAKLADMESRMANGDLPSSTELNSVRRLVTWAEGKRDLARLRALTTDGEG